MKVHIHPQFRGEDKGDGGVRRVVEAQYRWLPEHGVELVEEPRLADVLACHITGDKRLLERYPDIPLVAHNHGFYWAEYNWPNWCQKANTDCMELIRQSDAVTAPSEWVAQAVRRNSLRPAIPIRHGVDLDEWPAEHNDSRGYVLWNKTRTDPVCDPDALNDLAKRVPDVSFLTTFGDKTLSNMTVTGRIGYEDAKDQVRRAAVYLCTARETFGIGTLEAMACGMPVLAWNWGGQRDILEHKVTGWLAKPGDFDDLERGLRYCLANRDAMGAAARQVVERQYQWRDVMKDYVALYDAVHHRAVQGPKVSVIVPAYNLAQFLPEALDSVLEQDFEGWECIVVDDASPDDCGVIAEDYTQKDQRFRAIHNPENQYLAGALNTGIGAATGKYIISLDADNLMPQGTLRTLSEALDDDRSIHIAYGNVEFLDSDGKRWHSGWPREFDAKKQTTRPNTDRPFNLIPSTAMYRRSVWQYTGGYRRRWRTAEDADYWTRAASYGFRAKQVTQADTLVYRNREGSMSRDEGLQDWTTWFPWTRHMAAPPAAIDYDPQVPIPSYEPEVVSIIIPVGPGHEQLVQDALDSMDAQIFRMWECIVINDTGQPLRGIPAWAHVVNPQTNQPPGAWGVAKARNEGIAVSRASLFLPLDADDTIEPECLVHMIRAYRQFKGYVYSDWMKRERGAEPEVWETQEYDANLLTKIGSLHAVTALYPRSAWQRVGGFDEDLPGWEDWDFQLALANIGVCGTRIPIPLFTYRVDTGMRREENYAAFDRSKQAILSKWEPYFKGKEELMGCGRCPGGGKGKVARPAQRINRGEGVAVPAGAKEDYVLVEYTGMRQGAMNFKGEGTGVVYRFSARDSGKRKLVHQSDADFFNARTDFKVLLGQPVG